MPEPPQHPDGFIPDGFTQLAMNVVDVAYMRLEPGCRELAGEFLLILARVTFDGYELFPGKEANGAGPKTD